MNKRELLNRFAELSADIDQEKHNRTKQAGYEALHLKTMEKIKERIQIAFEYIRLDL